VIIDALLRWVEEYGEAPKLADWEPARARRQGQEWRARRWEAGDWPSLRSVQSQFGTMSAAVRAAGLDSEAACHSTRRVDTAETVIAAIHEWHRCYGATPRQSDWQFSHDQHGSDDHFAGGAAAWPSIAAVEELFGSLREAISAAGPLPEPGAGPASPWGPPSEAGLAAERWQQLLALRVRAVAEANIGGDVRLLVEALNDLSAAAFGWADHLAGPSQASWRVAPRAPTRERVTG
jgi:hypothetical protein